MLGAWCPQMCKTVWVWVVVEDIVVRNDPNDPQEVAWVKNVGLPKLQLDQLAVSRHRWLLPPPELFIKSTNISSNFPRLICYNLHWHWHWHWRATGALHFFTLFIIFQSSCDSVQLSMCFPKWCKFLQYFESVLCLDSNALSNLSPSSCFSALYEVNKGDLQMLLVFSCGEP